MTMNSSRPAGREVRRRMGRLEQIGHAILIIFTCGMWYPFYRGRKKNIERTTDIYSND